MNTESILAMFGLPGGAEWVIILLGALLIFGRRLPEVARSIGKSIVEFKKGVRDIRDDVDHESQPNRLDRQTPDAVSHDATSEPANSADPTPVAPGSPSAADTETATTTEAHTAPVAPSSPTPQSNDS